MKIIAVLLSIHVLILGIVPAFSSHPDAFIGDNCCPVNGDESAAGCQSDHEDKCPGVCNPFMICCHCYALAIQTYIVPNSTTYLNRKFTFLTENLSSDFISEAWNPPKGESFDLRNQLIP